MKVALCVVVFFVASGFASVTNMVTNSSFETPSHVGFPEHCTGPGCIFNRGPIPGWTEVGETAGQIQPGTQFHNHALFNSVPDGITFGYSNGGRIFQTVGPTVQEDEIYTLMVDIGHRHDAPFMGSADLLVGSTTVPAIGDVPSAGNWSTYTARFVGTTANEGETITIQLNASGIQGAFDDVRLTSEPVPEPSSLLLLASGGLGLAQVLRRKLM
jgi:hypothetical protein